MDASLSPLRVIRMLAQGPTARSIKGLWSRLFFWPLYAVRKRRLERFGLARRSDAPAAPLDLGADCSCRHKYFATQGAANVKGFDQAAGPKFLADRFGQTAAVIDLARFPDFQAWRRQVSKLTEGKYHRSANKARRLGYASRFIGAKSYARSLYELTGSKPRRSKGILVWASIIGPREGLVDTGAPMTWSSCPLHWRLTWGAFRAEQGGERLAAFAKLVRAGDLVRVESFIGHGAALTDGVTKMLMFDIMEWLLAREHPHAQGVRYLLHGSVEEGGIGLFDWKRYLGFVPMLFDIVMSYKDIV